MTNSTLNKAVATSDRTYRRLLAVYPAEHRREYGPAMAQVFRDQCRDAWGEKRWRGLTLLWLRVLPDLAKTSLLEHLTARKERKSMFNRLFVSFVQHSSPTRVFVKVFLAVTLLIFLASAAITLVVPKSYCGMARIKIERDLPQAQPDQPAPVFQTSYDPYFIQTEFEVIQSQVVLNRVIAKLDLNTVWGKKYTGGQPFKTAESLDFLKRTLELRPVRNASLIEIRAFSDDPRESALIANGVAESYRDLVTEQSRQTADTRLGRWEELLDKQKRELAGASDEMQKLRGGLNLPDPEPPEDKLEAKYPAYAETKQHFRSLLQAGESLETKIAAEKNALAMSGQTVQIVDAAIPNLKPVRPNIPLNLLLGAIFGVFLGAVAGAAAAGITLKARKNHLANLKQQGASA